jgi:hypothetical protein
VPARHAHARQHPHGSEQPRHRHLLFAIKRGGLLGYTSESSVGELIRVLGAYVGWLVFDRAFAARDRIVAPPRGG